MFHFAIAVVANQSDPFAGFVSEPAGPFFSFFRAEWLFFSIGRSSSIELESGCGSLDVDRSHRKSIHSLRRISHGSAVSGAFLLFSFSFSFIDLRFRSASPFFPVLTGLPLLLLPLCSSPFLHSIGPFCAVRRGLVLSFSVFDQRDR